MSMLPATLPSPIMPVYNPAPVAPVRGEGPWLWDAAGTRWLDCIGGVATNALGHCHPALVRALGEQAARLWHVSNALEIPGQNELARKLIAATFADPAFFCNTGTEAETEKRRLRERWRAESAGAICDPPMTRGWCRGF